MTTMFLREHHIGEMFEIPSTLFKYNAYKLHKRHP